MTEASPFACVILSTALLAFPGSRDGVLMRPLASHQCGPGLTAGPSIISGLSLLLVLAVSQGFFSRVFWVSSLHLNQHF